MIPGICINLITNSTNLGDATTNMSRLVRERLNSQNRIKNISLIFPAITQDFP